MVRLRGKHASEFPNGLVVAAGVGQNTTSGGCADHFGTNLICGATDKATAEVGVRVCQAEIRGCERWVFPDRLLKVGNTLFEVSLTEPFDEPAFEIALVDLRRDMTRGDQSGTLFPSDGSLHFLSDRLCHLALESE